MPFMLGKTSRASPRVAVDVALPSITTWWWLILPNVISHQMLESAYSILTHPHWCKESASICPVLTQSRGGHILHSVFVPCPGSVVNSLKKGMSIACFDKIPIICISKPQNMFRCDYQHYEPISYTTFVSDWCVCLHRVTGTCPVSRFWWALMV